MFMSSLLIDNCSRLYRSGVTAVAVLTVSKHWRKFKALWSSIACSCIRCIQGWIQDLQVTGYLWITVTNMWLPTVGSPLGCLKAHSSWKFDKNSLKWSNTEVILMQEKTVSCHLLCIYWLPNANSLKTMLNKIMRKVFSVSNIILSKRSTF